MTIPQAPPRRIHPHQAVRYRGGTELYLPFHPEECRHTLKREVPRKALSWHPERRCWFVAIPYDERALALAREFFPDLVVTSAHDDAAPIAPVRRPTVEPHHYHVLHLQPGAPVELAEAAHDILSRRHDPRLADDQHLAIRVQNALNEALEAIRYAQAGAA